MSRGRTQRPPRADAAGPVRRRLDEVFGDVLPEVTRDERATPRTSRAAAARRRVAARQPPAAPRRDSSTLVLVGDARRSEAPRLRAAPGTSAVRRDRSSLRPSPITGAAAAAGAAAAFGEQVADLREQLDVRRLGRAGLLAALAARLEGVQRQHDHEVDDRGDDQEVERRGDHGREVDVGGLLALDELDAEARAGRRGHGVDQRLDDARRERRDDGRERGADDDRDREVDDVAAQDEVLETLDHVSAG